MNRPSGPDLSDKTILIVEDAFYLAIELKEEVERAGGTVAGPCADAKDGLAELERRVPDGAVVDINLGTGPSFEIADSLSAADVPFLFVTGYDAAAIPERFDHIDRVQKPVNVSRLLTKLGDLTAQRGGTSSPR